MRGNRHSTHQAPCMEMALNLWAHEQSRLKKQALSVKMAAFILCSDYGQTPLPPFACGQSRAA